LGIQPERKKKEGVVDVARPTRKPKNWGERRGTYQKLCGGPKAEKDWQRGVSDRSRNAWGGTAKDAKTTRRRELLQQAAKPALPTKRGEQGKTVVSLYRHQGRNVNKSLGGALQNQPALGGEKPDAIKGWTTESRARGPVQVRE